MSDLTTEERLTRLLAAQMGDEVPFTDMDSLDRVEFVMSVEEEFGLEISDEMAVGFHSMEDVRKYVDTMTAGPAHGAH